MPNQSDEDFKMTPKFLMLVICSVMFAFAAYGCSTLGCEAVLIDADGNEVIRIVSKPEVRGE